VEKEASIPPLRLEAFKVHDEAPRLVPGSSSRAWMDVFPDRHAYRCLPLSIANAHSWDILCPIPFEIEWNGGPRAEDLVVRPLEPMPGRWPFKDFARSHFTQGIVTLHTNYLFRTPPGWSLLVHGPFNEPKSGISPLTGLIESDWLPYPFTMNWKMLQIGKVRFEADEPYCSVTPIPKNYLDDWDVAIHRMTDDPVLAAEHEAFRVERDDFMRRFIANDPEAFRQAWQRYYFIGRYPDGTAVENHNNKVRLAEPQDLSGTRPLHAKTAPAFDVTALPSRRVSQAIASVRYTLAAGPMQMIMSAAPSERADQSFENVTYSLAAGPMQSVSQRTSSRPASLRTGPWQPDSILNTLDNGQNERNYAGRRRFKKGVLSQSPDTVAISAKTDLSRLDFICVPNFLSAADCKLLAEATAKLAHLQHNEGVDDPYWKGRILFFADVHANIPQAAAVMRAAQDRVTERIQKFYKLNTPVYADTVQLVRWREGMHMEPHADRANPDGTPHGMAWRDFASIVYLNDDYLGGELYLTQLDMLLKPTAGMLVAFTGGWHHEHAVLKVTKGDRLTMPAFYTVDAGKKDRSVYG